MQWWGPFQGKKYLSPSVFLHKASSPAFWLSSWPSFAPPPVCPCLFWILRMWTVLQVWPKNSFKLVYIVDIIISAFPALWVPALMCTWSCTNLVHSDDEFSGVVWFCVPWLKQFYFKSHWDYQILTFVLKRCNSRKLPDHKTRGVLFTITVTSVLHWKTTNFAQCRSARLGLLQTL